MCGQAWLPVGRRGVVPQPQRADQGLGGGCGVLVSVLQTSATLQTLTLPSNETTDARRITDLWACVRSPRPARKHGTLGAGTAGQRDHGQLAQAASLRENTVLEELGLGNSQIMGAGVAPLTMAPFFVTRRSQSWTAVLTRLRTWQLPS